MTETEACIAINMIPGIGPVRLRKLLSIFRSPSQILQARPGDLKAVEGIPSKLVETITKWKEHVDLEAELKRIADFGAKIITFQDSDYPPVLSEIHNPPILLYVWGNLEKRDLQSIGIVGSRRTSHYGLECAKKLSYQIAYAGMTVISGLARGIDTAAHHGALAAKGRTIAVLGSGLNHLYPPENQALAEKISESGAVVTEFSMDTKPDQQTFPMRNRIISGWSTGLLVVEAGLNSGALITANQAVEQGKSVFAVPGPIDRPTSRGSNRLIQQGAKLIMGAEDILDELHILLPQQPELIQSAPAPDLLNTEERVIYEAISDSETGLEEIVVKSGLPMSTVSSTLLTLEIKRLVKQLPGQHFVKLL